MKKEQTAFQGVRLYGTSVAEILTNADCQIYHLSNETGTGILSSYQVFPGVELIYNDIHMAYCNQNQETVKNLIEINHCREGRYECCFGENSCSIMTEGDLSIDPLTRKKSSSSFPLGHYHGISILINPEEIPGEIQGVMSALSIDLKRIQHYICRENRCCIMRANESIEHIFSELYHVREQKKAGYMKIKILELLLFLSDLDTRQEVIQTEYLSRQQVELIKKVAAFITSDITSHHTIAFLADRFRISATSLKKYFKGVYGSSIYSYLRTYRLQTGLQLLKKTDFSVTEIAVQIGYENPNKFTSAFKKTYGLSPTAYRKSVQLDSSPTGRSGENPDPHLKYSL